MSNPDLTHAVIRKHFHIKHHDNMPLTGWAGWRGQLPEIFKELNYTKGAEVGVGEGLFSESICKSNPELELICIDPWMICPDYPDESVAAEAYEKAKTRLAPYKTTVMRIASLGAVHMIPNHSLDFVYLDALHDFDNVMQDIIYWTPKIRSGGIMCGHAFSHLCTAGGGGTIFAVEAYIRGHGIYPWYLAHRDFKEPSWLWVC